MSKGVTIFFLSLFLTNPPAAQKVIFPPVSYYNWEAQFQLWKLPRHLYKIVNLILIFLNCKFCKKFWKKVCKKDKSFGAFSVKIWQMLHFF